jgi:hypothetical protein
MKLLLSLRGEEFPTKLSEYLLVKDCDGLRFFVIMSSPTSTTPDFFPVECQCICSHKVFTYFLLSDVCSFSSERQANIMGPEQEMGRELSGSPTGQPQQCNVPG